MGLDMFARATKSKLPKPVDFDTDGLDTVELQYWRKHPNLHGWMEALYREKGGTEEFNCTGVELTREDIDRLEKEVTGNALPQTSGFFFGQSTPEDKASDLEFIQKARAAFDAGESVFYTSWW